MRTRSVTAAVLAGILAGTLGGCAADDGAPGAMGLADGGQAAPAAAEPAPEPPALPPAIRAAGLENVHAVVPGLISGSAPDSDEAFDALAAMGVRTIISVDGAAPDAERARARGMRYVHLPLGYDGISESEKLRLTRAVRDLPGPVYVHCLHGHHRGPAAAALIAVTRGAMTCESAVEWMREAGASEHYKGLYAAVAGAGVLDDAALDAVAAEFPERAETSGTVQAMAVVERATDRLRAVQKAGWRTPPEHPDLSGANEARIIAETLASLALHEESRQRPREFMALLDACERQARELGRALADDPADAEHATTLMAELGRSCKACHVAFRD